MANYLQRRNTTAAEQFAELRRTSAHTGNAHELRAESLIETRFELLVRKAAVYRIKHEPVQTRARCGLSRSVASTAVGAVVEKRHAVPPLTVNAINPAADLWIAGELFGAVPRSAFPQDVVSGASPPFRQNMSRIHYRNEVLCMLIVRICPRSATIF